MGKMDFSPCVLHSSVSHPAGTVVHPTGIDKFLSFSFSSLSHMAIPILHAQKGVHAKPRVVASSARCAKNKVGACALCLVLPLVLSGIGKGEMKPHLFLCVDIVVAWMTYPEYTEWR